MGGELEKKSLEENKNLNELLKSEKNKKSKNKNKKEANDTLTTETVKSNNHKRGGGGKKKKEKVQVVAKDKSEKTINYEKKVLQLIHDKNPAKEDYDMIYDIISKHFFLQALTHQAKEEIIISMSLYKVSKGVTLYTQGFGERALMDGTLRSNTIIADTDCNLWALRRQVFRKIIEFIFTSTYEENMKFLEQVDIPIESTLKSIMANNLIQEIYLKGQYICREGEFGSSLYIIKDGEVECLKGETVIRILKKGDNFGQKALLEGDVRSLDVRAKTDCKIYSISSEFFKSQYGDNFKTVLYFNFITISFNNSKIFKKINSKIITKSFQYFKFRSLKNNEIVYQKGQKINEKLCVVLEGNIVDKKINRVEAKRYEILFEKKLSEGAEDDLKNNLVAEPDCILAEIDFDKFKETLGGDLNEAQTKSNQLASFEHVPMFRILSDDKIEFLQNNLKVEKFANGKKIITQGEIGDKLFIIKKGRVDFFVNSRYIRSLNDGEEFGARSLILSTEKRSASAIANGEVTCYTLTADVFKSILEPNLYEYFTNKIFLEDNTIELKDLDNVKELGSGNFGSVNLVRNKKNKFTYAIKALNLEQIKLENLEECVEVERDVLLKIDHPFIMKMVKYLKNDSYIFFINEYIKGKELWEVIRDIGLLNKEQTQYYGGSILLAIDYLHKQKIIYRDIKPENVMVSVKGYIKIIDFGTVKEIQDRTSTIIGTSHYMAPEITKGEGYSFQVDIWSIAICMYEFFCGKLPFGEDYDDPMDIYRAVSQEELTFPSFVKDKEFMTLMNKMLRKSPTNRLWKFKQIKEDPYFKDFDWNKLISLSYPPPYKLKMKEEKESSGQSIPYLSYLQSKAVKRGGKKKKSNRQIKFEKWLKNF